MRTSHHILAAIVALVVTPTAMLQAARTAVPADAQAAYPPAHALALPKSTLPRWMVVHGDAVSDQTAALATRLHAVSLTDVGRVEGYLESAWWRPASRSRQPAHPMTLLYEASIFHSPDGATAAYGDARAGLWEIGFPRPEQIQGRPVFEVDERDGHRDVFVLLEQGSIEAELRLRYTASIDRQTLQAGLWYLWRVSNAAALMVGHIAQGLPPAPSPASPSPTPSAPSAPPIYVSPWGTGPVVKSPSLMALDGGQVPANMVLDPGAYRVYGAPDLFSRASGHPALVPTGALARYARTGALGTSMLYEATALYSSPQSATEALNTLATANDNQRELQPFSLPAPAWNAPHLSTLDISRAWQRSGETIFAFRLQNVIVTLAETGETSDVMAGLADRLVATIPTWLHAQGTDMVNAAGDHVRLVGLNWYGAEQQDFVVGGLDYQQYEGILQAVKRLGYNCIRLPYSNQMVEQNPIVSAHMSANPELAGLHALDIMDRIINYAGALGISVILDDHRSEAGWSAEDNGLWYTQSYPDAAFVHDWTTLAQRYAVNNVVIAADLRNEPHAAATWGDGNPATDWLAAAERAGNAVLGVDPHLLIMVEGIQYYGSSGSYWWGGNLLGVAVAPVVLHFADGSPARSQLVYSAHDYGPDNCSAGCTWFNATTTYDSLAQLWSRFWGYVSADPGKPYAAPVWVGEFGTCNYQPTCVSDTTPGSQGQWFSSLVRYIAENHLGWAYWSLNGTESTGGTRVYGALDWYGYFTKDWSAPVPLLNTQLQTLQEDGTPGTL